MPSRPKKKPGLNPGIRKLVKFLNDEDFVTCDSGDGKTHDFKCDRERAYVVVTLRYKDDSLIAETERLQELLRRHGVRLHQVNPDGYPCVQATYDPYGQETKSIIEVMGVVDDMLSFKNERTDKVQFAADNARICGTYASAQKAEMLADAEAIRKKKASRKLDPRFVAVNERVNTLTEDMIKGMGRLNAAKDDRLHVLTRIINETLSSFYDPRNIKESGHKCPESPSEHCVYDIESDPDTEKCIFCKKPWERQ
jgi:hypothetical protein